MQLVIGRVVIEQIRPQVDCGQWPARAVAGETVPVQATIFRDGHTVEVAATVRVNGPGERQEQRVRMTETNPGLHHWEAEITLPATGMWSFTVEAWTDELATWLRGTRAKLDAGRDVELELEEGALLLEREAARLPAARRGPLLEAIAGLRGASDLATRLGALHLASEVCDWRRFDRASAFMGFCGLVPSEYSSG
ncbi:MAG TPA: maltotransferase domain-containing protein, partial [Actinomycetes bacterium]|nr:maltotransferase domain-containing protein [Actinomycetes bacterium]